MFEPWTHPFMIRALIAGAMASLLGGYYGAIVVQRKMSFLGHGLAHGAFGGVALGLLLGIEPLWLALPFTLAMALAMAWAPGRTPLSGDAAVGVFYSAAMALGVVFLFWKEGYAGDPMAYLFGSILYVRPVDLWLMAAISAASLFTIPLWGRWAYAAFDRELALADRQNVARDDALLYLAVAAVVVVAVKLVGILLVGAFLVIPPATARLWRNTFSSMTIASMGLGLASVVAGLWASYELNLPSGACIILLQSAIFFVSLAARRGAS